MTSPHLAHFREECKHGFLIAQCRCTFSPKQKRIGPCPKACVFKDPPRERSYPGSGLKIDEIARNDPA